MNKEQTVNYDDISPGVRHLVRKMNEWGFKTCDSGDGSNFKNGMECALDFPHILAIIPMENSFKETDRLYDLLSLYIPNRTINIEMTYSPIDKNCIIMVTGDIIGS